MLYAHIVDAADHIARSKAYIKGGDNGMIIVHGRWVLSLDALVRRAASLAFVGFNPKASTYAGSATSNA